MWKKFFKNKSNLLFVVFLVLLGILLHLKGTNSIINFFILIMLGIEYFFINFNNHRVEILTTV